jgi:hypothetical protein
VKLTEAMQARQSTNTQPMQQRKVTNYVKLITHPHNHTEQERFPCVNLRFPRNNITVGLHTTPKHRRKDDARPMHERKVLATRRGCSPKKWLTVFTRQIRSTHGS